MERLYQSIVGDYLIEVDIKLREKKELLVLSICGGVYQSKTGHTICNGRIYGKGQLCFGQCNEEIAEIVKLMPDGIEKKRREWILEIREKYHLNDLHAGTVKQENFLKKIHSDGSRYDYTKDCEELDKEGLLYDHGYKYGSSWLFRKIPNFTLNRIKDFIS